MRIGVGSRIGRPFQLGLVLLVVALGAPIAARSAQPGGADLEIEALTVAPPLVEAGGRVRYQVVARNLGPEDAVDVQVLGHLPRGLSHAADDGAGAYEPATGRWRIGPLEAGARATLVITATADDPPTGPTGSGAFLDRFVVPGAGGLDGPVELRFREDGDLLLTSSGSDAILRFDGRSGAFVSALVASGAGGLRAPDGLVEDDEGRLYVASAGSDEVLRYDAATGEALGAFVAAGAGGLSAPGALLFLPDGDLLVAEPDAARILRFDGRDGAFRAVLVAPGEGGLRRPFGMALGPRGDLFVSDGDADAVRRYDADTGASKGDFVAPGSGGLFAPDRLRFGPDGRLYVASAGTGQVLRYDGVTGRALGAFAEGGPEGLPAPSGLAFGADGHLYAASYDRAEVQRFDGFLLTRARIGDVAPEAPPDPRPENDEREVALALRPPPDADEADLALRLEALGQVEEPGAPGGIGPSPERVSAGRSLTYTLHAVNRGPAVATGARAVLTLPLGVDVLGARLGSSEASCDQAQAGGAAVLSCALGDLVVGESPRLQVRAGSRPELEDGAELLATADLRSGVRDGSPLDNLDAAVLRAERRSDLALDLALAEEALAVGGTAELRLRVRNAGPSLAEGAVLTATLPAGLARLSSALELGSCAAPSAGLRCELDALAPGQEVEIAYRGLLADGLPGRRVALRGAVRLQGAGDPWPENDAAVAALRVLGGEGDLADLRLDAHRAESTDPAPGEELVFRLRLRNDGPAEAPDPRVAHRLPPGLRYERHEGAGTFDAGETASLWRPGPLAPGQSEELRIVTRVARTGQVGWPSASGAYLGALTSATRPAAPGKMTLGPDGDLYLADARGEVLRYDGATGRGRAPFVPAGASTLRFASALAWGPDGDLYVADAAADAVLRYDGVLGDAKGVFVAPGAGGLSAPSDLAFGPDGALYVADQLGSRVLRFDGASGAFQAEVLPEQGEGLALPSALAFDAEGDLWVASGGGGELLRIAPASGALRGRIDTAASGVAEPGALLFGVLGEALVGDAASGALRRFRRDGGDLGAFADDGPPRERASGLAFALDGSLLIADGPGRRVARHDGFPLAWARVASTSSRDPDLTNDRRSAGFLPPWSGPVPTATPVASPSVTPDPSGTPPPPTTPTTPPPPTRGILLPYAVRP